ncbi:MAG: S-methyl-5-thioribose-1-phosphate isomerase [Aigarchaeota archaeon]|nr:S-methyl-5-thioribose-1-phosphate isomerase [Aigarchaeota archaeon]MCX8192278.1 S-methyl-5-thioribose-1-phosphate isomerase [Nitrososphaeria archaeon]MDW7986114.1 S-methyl-5-thioribose-1-phosphate isomerase [Nitrososphaerota archaeon]
MKKEFRTIWWDKGSVVIIDQRLIPYRIKYIKIRSYKEMANAIKKMAIRGAPAIGVAAAMGMALAVVNMKSNNKEMLINRLEKAGEIIRSTRPTAVNLFWAVDRIMKIARESPSGEKLKINVLNEALRMAEEDIEINKKIGEIGSRLIEDGDKILTHCNAGALATVGHGTALGVIKTAYSQGKRIIVYASETRPRLQGAKLTTWELIRENIPVKLITDNMSAFLMQKKEISKVIVGADRILAKTGHVINKIGTLSHAITAKYYGIPFIVAAPSSSIDLNHNPDEVVIEERDVDEVLYIDGVRIAPRGVEVVNPAFDITPPELVSYIVTEKGVFKPEELRRLVE